MHGSSVRCTQLVSLYRYSVGTSVGQAITIEEQSIIDITDHIIININKINHFVKNNKSHKLIYARLRFKACSASSLGFSGWTSQSSNPLIGVNTKTRLKQMFYSTTLYIAHAIIEFLLTFAATNKVRFKFQFRIFEWPSFLCVKIMHRWQKLTMSGRLCASEVPLSLSLGVLIGVITEPSKKSYLALICCFY